MILYLRFLEFVFRIPATIAPTVGNSGHFAGKVGFSFYADTLSKQRNRESSFLIREGSSIDN